MTQNMYENPFIQCTARDMSYDDVMAYWCNPFNSYNISESDLFKSRTPIFIEGARGSGKTMILKYMSYHCQKKYINEGEDPFRYFKNIGTIGVYLRYKEDFVNMLLSISCEPSIKNDLFSYHFELLISREIIQILIDLYSEYSSEKLTSELESILEQLSSYSTENFKSLDDVLLYIHNRILRFDDWIRNYRYYSESEKELSNIIRFGFISNIVSAINLNIEMFKNVLFVILIDEYENAKIYQKNINTYIKQVDESKNITYRLGMRVEGITTYATNIGDEILQDGRDYLLMKLISKNNAEYQKFLKTISKKRLSSNKFFKDYNEMNIENILGKKEDLVNEALSIVGSDNNLIHFDLLKKSLTDDEFKYALEKLKCNENPLLEMLNILWVLRNESNVDMHQQIDTIYSEMIDYLNKKSDKNSKYKQDYINKYKYQLVFTLLSIYTKHSQKRLKKSYYSFNTFSFLSSGSVNDFISLCRDTFNLIDEDYFDNFEINKLIPPTIQTDGAIKTALDQLERIKKNDENGTRMYTFIMNIGNLFNSYHRDQFASYPETNQFAFEDEASIESRELLKQCLKSMLKWGVLIKKKNIQSISIGRRKGEIYYLNHIFAPLFNISYRIRGGYNPVIPTDLFEQMLTKSMEPLEIKTCLTQSQNKPKKETSKEKTKQIRLCDFDEETL